MDFKKLSIQQLETTLHNILYAYGELYDKAGSDRDAMFLKDLVDMLLPIQAMVQDHVNGSIHPTYAMGKVLELEQRIKSQKNYWEWRANGNEY